MAEWKGFSPIIYWNLAQALGYFTGRGGGDVLTPCDRAVYLILLIHGTIPEGFSWPGNTTMAKSLGYHVGSVRRSLARLQARRLIAKTLRTGTDKWVWRMVRPVPRDWTMDLFDDPPLEEPKNDNAPREGGASSGSLLTELGPV